ncbi:DUF4272 domain-containing protein [Bacillus sp. NPDC077027]|uniref:DUF4272 domain-containing protein n=1 Tax=Bacillus sp. NPDC077027 TaxID=3390548 RepID=UPI003D037C2A
MKNGTIFLTQGSKQEIIQTIQELFQGETLHMDENRVSIQRGRFLSKVVYTLNILSEEDQYQALCELKMGQRGYIDQVIEAPLVKKQLIRKNANTRTAIALVSKRSMPDDVIQLLLKLAKQYSGFLFVDGVDYIDGDGQSLLEINELRRLDPLHMKGVRFQTIDQLVTHELPIGQLPLYEERDSFKSREDICRRMIALFIYSVKGDGHQQGVPSSEVNEVVTKLMDRFEAKSFFSPQEWAFMSEAEPEEVAARTAVWSYEALYALMGATGMIETRTMPDHMCDVDAINELFFKLKNKEELLEKIALQADVRERVDLVYMLHWISVEQRINGGRMTVPVPIIEDVVKEWHKALNWVYDEEYDNWDEVETHT